MITELKSPLSTHLINRLRAVGINALLFRETIKRLSILLADTALSDKILEKSSVDTWQGTQTFKQFSESELLFVTVLRAGLPMIEAMMDLFPEAQAGFLAIKRDEQTHKATLYYDRVPDCKDKHVIIVDPMVATGGSMIDAMEVLKGRQAKSIQGLNIIAAPEGLEALTARYPELNITVAQIDQKLNNDKYIIPGLGDAGDRAYNTPE